MKKIATLFILILCSIQLVSGQKTNASSFSPPALRSFYWQKSKTKRMLGLALLLAGTVMANEEIKINGSQLQPVRRNMGGTKINGYNKKLWLARLGKATISASIPFFISSGDYRERAVHFDRKEYRQ